MCKRASCSTQDAIALSLVDLASEIAATETLCLVRDEG